jgi:hypothetical protein
MGGGREERKFNGNLIQVHSNCKPEQQREMGERKSEQVESLATK